MKFDIIHQDNRGFIGALTEDLTTYPECAILKTVSGVMRGGCIHRINTEHLCVIEGEIMYVYGGDINNSNAAEVNVDEVGNFVVAMRVGDSISILPNTPHYFYSVTDSLVAEWGCQIKEKKEKHEAFRKIVMEFNKQNEK